MKNKILYSCIVVILIVVALILGYYLGKTVKTDTTYTYLSVSQSSDTEDLNYIKYIYTFNSNNICIDCRALWEFKTEEIAKNNYTNWEKSGNKNLKIESNKVTFNMDRYIGLTKDEIKDTVKKEGTIEECLEY